MLTSVYLIGWMWSIYWGYLIVVRSKGDHEQLKTLISSTQVKSDVQQPQFENKEDSQS